MSIINLSYNYREFYSGFFKEWVFLNKNKNSLYMILFFIFTLLFVMNLAIMPFSFVLSIINMSIIAVLAAITFFVIKNYENYLFNISKDIKNMIDEDEKSLINEVPSPVVILNSEEPYNMVFFNESFRKIFIDRLNSIDFFNNYSGVFSDIVKNKTGRRNFLIGNSLCLFFMLTTILLFPQVTVRYSADSGLHECRSLSYRKDIFLLSELPVLLFLHR